MNAGISPLDSFLFFYIFFLVLVIFLLYGLWEVHQAYLRTLPNPLSAVLLGIPESANLFEDVPAVLRVKNCGKTPLKIRVICGNSWIFSLKPEHHQDIPVKLDTMYAGRHEIKASAYCKRWEIHVFYWYHVYQRIVSQKEKCLKILGLKPGATRKEIRRARNRLAKQYHPDLGEGHEEEMKEINEAYRQLMAS